MRHWLAWTGTALCWLSAPIVAYSAIGAVLILLHPFVEQKQWALFWLVIAAAWCVLVWVVTAAHRQSAAATHFIGCNVGLLAGLAWVGGEILMQ